MKESNKNMEAKKDVLKELLAMCDEQMKGSTTKGLDEMRSKSKPQDLEAELKQAHEDANQVPAQEGLASEEEEYIETHSPDAEEKEESELDAKEHSLAPTEEEEESFFGKKKKK